MQHEGWPSNCKTLHKKLLKERLPASELSSVLLPRGLSGLQRRCATAASLRRNRMGASSMCCMPTGTSPWHPSMRWRRFRCFRSTTLGAICSSGCRRSHLPGSSRWSAVCRHRTVRIILSLITLRSSRGIGTTSSSLSGWRRRRS